MTKEKKDIQINASLSLEGMQEMMNELIAFCREMADKQDKREEKRQQERAAKRQRENWNAEKNVVKTEFARIGELLAKAKPGTDEYRKLTEDLKRLKDLTGYGWEYDDD